MRDEHVAPSHLLRHFPSLFPPPSPARLSQTKQIALAWETALNPDAAPLSLPDPSLLVPHTLPPLTFDPTPGAPLPCRSTSSLCLSKATLPPSHTKVEGCSASLVHALFSFGDRPLLSLGALLITLLSSHLQKSLQEKGRGCNR